MRKGEPNSRIKDWRRVQIRGTPCPELPHATCTPGAARCRPAPRSLAAPGSAHPAIPAGQRALQACRTLPQSKAKSPGGRPMWLRCRYLGKSVQGRDAFMKGKPPLTAKSLSANTVYHTLEFGLARGAPPAYVDRSIPDSGTSPDWVGSVVKHLGNQHPAALLFFLAADSVETVAARNAGPRTSSRLARQSSTTPPPAAWRVQTAAAACSTRSRRRIAALLQSAAESS